MAHNFTAHNQSFDLKALEAALVKTEDGKKQDIQIIHKPSLPGWMADNNCSFVITSYKSHMVIFLGVRNGSIYTYSMMQERPTGIGLKDDMLYVSNIGNIITYVNRGSIDTPLNGTFDANFCAKNINVGAHIDVHDIDIGVRADKIYGDDIFIADSTKESSADIEARLQFGPNIPEYFNSRAACSILNRTIYYCSTGLNSICIPSDKYTCEIYWTPPWIKLNEKGNPPNEDRCHLNGLCCVDGKPKYVTAVCMRDYIGAWQEHMDEGVLYDIVENKVVCSKLIMPHSPRVYRDKIWLLESGTGYFGYVEGNKFVQKTFLPGFLRGLDFIGNFAVICTSLDRHDHAFRDTPVSRKLKQDGRDSKCGIWVINLDTFEIESHIHFSDMKELYDIKIIKNCQTPRILGMTDSVVWKNVYLPQLLGKVEQKPPADS